MATDGWLADAERVDTAIYAAIAGTPTPSLDRAMKRLSAAADHSKLNAAAGLLLAATGGESGRRAAGAGLRAVALSSLVVNVALKPAARRRRPDRELHSVPDARHVDMPTSRSLPSGHSASAFAFATAVGQVLPRTGAVLRLGAAVVAYSRVHTGVHFPGDVVAGALAGSTLAQVAGHAPGRS